MFPLYRLMFICIYLYLCTLFLKNSYHFVFSHHFIIFEVTEFTVTNHKQMVLVNCADWLAKLRSFWELSCWNSIKSSTIVN